MVQFSNTVFTIFIENWAELAPDWQFEFYDPHLKIQSILNESSF